MSGGAAETTTDPDVAVVGGGPAGSAAAVFLARYGLDTVVFDRGAAAIDRCAYLENYPGFPAGIGVDTFRDLLAAHVEEAGADPVAETVETVERADGDRRFRVETDARSVTADYVLAAAWYDGSYLRGLDGAAMFSEQEHHGEIEERFDPEYPDADGRTPVAGLYVASPSERRSAQAVVAAGNGAHVARRLLGDHRRDQGYPEDLAEVYDWLRRESEFSGEWADRDRWREWFETEAGDHDVEEERFVELRERYLDEAFETRRSPAAVEDLRARGIDRLVSVLGEDRVLDAVSDDRIRERAAALEGTPEVSD